MLKAIAKALIALNSNVRREQIAAGFACGVLLALVPAGNLLWFVLFALIIFFKINFGMLFAALGIFKLLQAPLSPGLDALGWYILNLQALRPAFTALYNVPIAPLTRFNNTIVAGGFVAGVILWLPLYFAARSSVTVYRTRLAPKIAESKAYKTFVKLPLVRTIVKALSAANEAAGALG
jgi:uncharacterized protein (TIGR03546 family)